MAHWWPRVAVVGWVLLSAAQAQAQTGPGGPAGTALQDPSVMERAQREADGPRRRILEAAKAKAKDKAPSTAALVAKAVDTAAPRPKAVPAASTAAAVPAAMAASDAIASLSTLNIGVLPRLELQTAAADSPTRDRAAVPAPEALRAPAEAEPQPQPQPQPLTLTLPSAPAPAMAPSVPMATPSSPAVAEASASELAYTADLGRLVDSLKRYPSSREARSLRPQGTVRVWLDIDRQGQLLEAGLQAPSGAPLLDGEALRSLRQGRYAPFPAGAFEGAASRRFVVAIEYRSEGN